MAPLPRLKLLETEVDHCGRYTSRIPPHTMPINVPVPPSTMAASNWIERVSGNSPVLTTPIESPRNAPPRPAHPALMVNAMTFVRTTWIPASEAAISSSRTARKARP